MTKEPLIADFMTLQPQTIEAGVSVEQAQKMMSRFGIRHLPVTDNGVVVGVLSEREIHLALGIEPIDPGRLLAIDVCSERPYIVSPDTTLREVVGVMAGEHLGSAIVMENAKLTGIFTTVDACRALHDLLEKALEAVNIENIRSLRFLLSRRS
jgi:CBS domain-containing protein